MHSGRYCYILETVAKGCSVKKVFLEVSHNSHETAALEFLF